METKLYQIIASASGAHARCIAEESDWADKWYKLLDDIELNHLPSGSGVDSGTRIDRDATTETRIVLTCDFHHMNDGGYYDGWTTHKIIITPAFDGFDLRVTGRDRNDIKDYLGDLFHHCLIAQGEATADHTWVTHEYNPVYASHLFARVSPYGIGNK